MQFLTIKCISTNKKNDYSDPTLDHLSNLLTVGNQYKAIQMENGDFVIPELSMAVAWEKENFTVINQNIFENEEIKGDIQNV